MANSFGLRARIILRYCNNGRCFAFTGLPFLGHQISDPNHSLTHRGGRPSGWPCLCTSITAADAASTSKLSPRPSSLSTSTLLVQVGNSIASVPLAAPAGTPPPPYPQDNDEENSVVNAVGADDWQSSSPQ